MRVTLLAVVGALISVVSGAASARTSAIRLPERHTAGPTDHFLGHLAPDGRHLYFVGTPNVTVEPFVVDLDQGGIRQVFEAGADVSLPRVSPDGRSLLYIAYRDDARGDACIYDLQGGGGRCLTGPDTADVEAFWFPDGRSIGVVSRRGLNDDQALWRVPLSGGAPTRVIERNLAHPAVSPDGRWVAFIPVTRTSERVGVGFAAHAAPRIAMVRLADGLVAEVQPAAPGASGFPAFSADGRWLYFTQYLNDTNFDGTIDGRDHAVIMRLPFDADADAPLSQAPPQQLTSAEWSCSYPAPARSRLVMTCDFEGSLDVYSLPLDGAVPPEFDEARLRAEIAAARNPWDELLMSAHLLDRVSDDARVNVLRHMTQVHLDMRGHASALWYNARAEAAAQGTAVGRQTAAMAELIGFREQEAALDLGALVGSFVERQRPRLERLDALHAEGGDVAALVDAVASEIEDVLGREDQALERVARIDLKAIQSPHVLRLAAARAVALYRAHDQRQKLIEVYALLEAAERLDRAERLHYARELVDELLRGVPKSKRVQRVELWTAKVDPDSDAALMLNLERILLDLTPATEEDVRARIFAMYRGTKELEPRKTLVLTTVARALNGAYRDLAYQFTNSWAGWLERGQPERRYGEALFAAVWLERAYGELAAGEVEDARARFWGVATATRELRAHVGFIEARIRSGHDDVREVYAKRFAAHPDPAVEAFVDAYLAARALATGPPLGRDVFLGRVRAATARLAAARSDFPQDPVLHHLWGTLAHLAWLNAGDRDAAQEAQIHYLVALDTARDDPRWRAAVLHQLGSLQASIGNHRQALRHLDARLKLPFVDAASHLHALLERAHSAYAIDRFAEASRSAAEALALVDGSAELAAYQPLALDRAALYAHLAGDHARSVDLYDRLMPLLDVEGAPAGRDPGNRVRARIGRAAAAIAAGRPGVAVADLEVAWAALIGEARREPDGDASAGAPRAPVYVGRAELRLLVSGLQASAYRDAGRPDDARAALERRLALLTKPRPPDVLLPLVAKVHHDLAALAWRRGDLAEARAALERGLRVTDQYAKAMNTPVTPELLWLLQGYAELHLDGGVPQDELALGLGERLRAAFDFISAHPAPQWEGHRRLFATYLTLLALEPPHPAAHLPNSKGNPP